jgi:glycosyltransferase involved in cell wall biosynthesis
LRILITVPSISKEFGGPMEKARGFAAATRSLGHDVIVVGVGSSSGGMVGLGRAGAFHGTPVPSELRSLARRAKGADIIHVMGYRDPVGTLTALQADRSDIPFVLEPAGMLQPRVRSQRLKQVFDSTVGQAILKRANSVVATSSVELDDFTSLGVPASKIFSRPNGIDVQTPGSSPANLRRRLGIPEPVPLVVTLARLSSIKGLETLARAIAHTSDVWWLLAGPDEQDGTRERVNVELGTARAFERTVIMPTGLWGADKWAALATADVFALSSTYESFGTAAAEAAGTGTPVIVTDRCGVKDVLPPESSLVVPTSNADALVHAIHSALDLKRAAQLSAADVRQLLDWKALAQRQLSAYASAGSPRR